MMNPLRNEAGRRTKRHGFRASMMFLAALTLAAAGCNRNPGSDPAGGNLAPVSAQTLAEENGAPPPPANPSTSDNSQQPAYSPAPAPAPEYAQPPSNYENPAGDYNGDGGYSDQAEEAPVDYAPEPPPPLPEYSQPECPGDNYIWTPGYWGYAPAGYYWVPGVWVLAPYDGALWTPGYWGYDRGRYGWRQGYWGQYIGFYGGVNYGFGYTGRGFYGGYWKGGTFQYNRAVANVSITRIYNTYSYKVTNVTQVTNVSRVSYNGGTGGIRLRPAAAELVAARGRRLPPLQVQMQHVEAARNNRAAFSSVNHGHPETAALGRPLAPERREPPAVPAANAERPSRPVQAERPIERSPAAGSEQSGRESNREAVQPQNRMRPAEPARPASEARPAQQARPPEPPRPVAPEQRPAIEARPQPNPQPQREAPRTTRPENPGQGDHSHDNGHDR